MKEVKDTQKSIIIIEGNMFLDNKIYYRRWQLKVHSSGSHGWVTWKPGNWEAGKRDGRSEGRGHPSTGSGIRALW